MEDRSQGKAFPPLQNQAVLRPVLVNSQLILGVPPFLLQKSSPPENSPLQRVGAHRNKRPELPLHALSRGREVTPLLPKNTQREGPHHTRESLEGNRKPSSLEGLAPSQETSRSSPHTQRWQKGLAAKQGKLHGTPGRGSRTAGLLLESLPGGQRPAEHLAAVLHYVAMAVGILHTVFPSPGTLDLQRTGHKLRSAPPASAPSLGTSRARRQGGGSCDRGSGVAQGNKGTSLTSSLVV